MAAAAAQTGTRHTDSVTNSEAEPAGEVQAGPTKQFFVSMITRDIALQPAIVDLVDNCVDGARRLRGEASLAGLKVEVNFDSSRFRIADNCGGIPLDIARQYAFKFGRPDAAPGVPHSVGQFGIGMKRALFKLGSAFSVESISADSSFSLRVDVEQWRHDSDSWNFPLTTAEVSQHPEATTGTILVVDKLHPEVSEDLALDSFKTGLIADIRAKHRISIGLGLAIEVNGTLVPSWPIEVLIGDRLTPGRQTLRFFSDRTPVTAILVAGIGGSAPQDAGWYVFCNNRLVLGPDRTRITGWGAGRGRSSIPQFHTQFARFRGYAFFDSERASLLPLTTTKVGVDTTSPVWRATQPRMVEMSRPVIDFLNAVDWENPQVVGDETGELDRVIEQARLISVSTMPDGDARFTAPSRSDITPPPRTSSIQYSRLVEDIDRAKALLGVSSNRDVGELTFEYYLEAEG